MHSFLRFLLVRVASHGRALFSCRASVSIEESSSRRLHPCDPLLSDGHQLGVLALPFCDVIKGFIEAHLCPNDRKLFIYQFVIEDEFAVSLPPGSGYGPLIAHNSKRSLGATMAFQKI